MATPAVTVATPAVTVATPAAAVATETTEVALAAAGVPVVVVGVTVLGTGAGVSYLRNNGVAFRTTETPATPSSIGKMETSIRHTATTATRCCSKSWRSAFRLSWRANRAFSSIATAFHTSSDRSTPTTSSAPPAPAVRITSPPARPSPTRSNSKTSRPRAPRPKSSPLRSNSPPTSTGLPSSSAISASPATTCKSPKGVNSTPPGSTRPRPSANMST